MCPWASYFPCVSFTHFICKMGPQSSLCRVLMRMKWDRRYVPFITNCKGVTRHGYFAVWVRVKEWEDPHVPGQIQNLCEFKEAKLEDSKFLVMEKSQQCHLNCWCIPLKLVHFLVEKSVLESLDHSILKRLLDSFPALPTLQLWRKDRYIWKLSATWHLTSPSNWETVDSGPDNEGRGVADKILQVTHVSDPAWMQNLRRPAGGEWSPCCTITSDGHSLGTQMATLGSWVFPKHQTASHLQPQGAVGLRAPPHRGRRSVKETQG